MTPRRVFVVMLIGSVVGPTPVYGVLGQTCAARRFFSCHIRRRAQITIMQPSEREHWNDRYRGPEPPPWDTGRPSAELQRRLAAFPVVPCRAIELGCGTGVNAVW